MEMEDAVQKINRKVADEYRRVGAGAFVNLFQGPAEDLAAQEERSPHELIASISSVLGESAARVAATVLAEERVCIASIGRLLGLKRREVQQTIRRLRRHLGAIIAGEEVDIVGSDGEDR